MKYCHQSTKNHIRVQQFPDCLVDMKTLLAKDGFQLHEKFNNTETLVIDGDELKTLFAKSKKIFLPKSMDVAFCIKDNVQEKMQLIELKSGNPNNLTRKMLMEKVKGSVLTLGTCLAINEECFFVFTSKSLKNEAVNRFFRMNSKIDNEYKPICLDELICYSKKQISILTTLVLQ